MSAELRALVISPDGSLWAAGDGGAILHSTDGGATWAAQTAPLQEDLVGIAFGTGDRGCVTGAGGAICWTDNGGLTWRVVRGKGAAWPDTLYSAAFVDPTHGIATGLAGDLFRTSDGGATWTKVTTAANMPMLDVAMADAQQGWAVSQGTTLLHTGDGGQAGRRRRSRTPSPAFVRGLHEHDLGLGGRVHGIVIHTSDGGANWDLQPKVTSSNLLDVSFADDRHGWIAGDGVILATANGGASWSIQYADDHVTLKSVSFGDAQEGWAVGRSYGSDHPHVLHTTNGGSTWSGADGGLPELVAVRFADAQHGWAVCNTFSVDSMPASGVYTTNDGGASWTVGGIVPGMLQGVTSLGAQLVWAVGDSGTLEYSPDGGAHWMTRTGNVSKLDDVGFSSAASAIAGGASGTILRSSSDGTFWTSSAPRRPASSPRWNFWALTGGQQTARAACTGPGTPGSRGRPSRAPPHSIWGRCAPSPAWTITPHGPSAARPGVDRAHQRRRVHLGTTVFRRAAHPGHRFRVAKCAGVPNGRIRVGRRGPGPDPAHGGRRRDLGAAVVRRRPARGGRIRRRSHRLGRRHRWRYPPHLRRRRDLDTTDRADRERQPVWFGGVACTDPETAWLVGLNGVIMHTSDGGATWRRQESGSPGISRA